MSLQTQLRKVWTDYHQALRDNAEAISKQRQARREENKASRELLDVMEDIIGRVESKRDGQNS